MPELAVVVLWGAATAVASWCGYEHARRDGADPGLWALLAVVLGAAAFFGIAFLLLALLFLSTTR